MKKLLMLAALAAITAGCSVTKINYKKDADGVCEYRIYHNDHWLKRDTGAMSGGMGEDGKFEVKLENAIASPSEEFNRTMQTYTSAIVSMMQIAAAAYNPSSSASAASISRGDAGNISRGDAYPPAEGCPRSGCPSRGETRSLGEAGAAAPDPAEGGSKNLRDSATPREENTGAGNDCPGGSCTTGECVDGSCEDCEDK